MEHQPFCYRCGTPCTPEMNFCAKCNVPISGLAMTGPYETVLAQGYMYSQASSNPRKPIVLAGILVFFIPRLILGCCVLYRVITDFLPDEGWPNWREIPLDVLAVGLPAGYVYIIWRIVSKTTRNYIRLRQLPPDDKAEAEAVDAQ